MNKIGTEDLSYFDLIIGSIPFLGNGFMLCSLFIKLFRKQGLGEVGGEDGKQWDVKWLRINIKRNK